MSQIMPALGANQQYCRSCGQIISSLAPTCPHCGAPTGVKSTPPGASDKLRLVALLLCLLVGMFGVHRFYVGKIGTGILQIVTLGGFGIWVLVDLILILLGAFKDKQGRPLLVWTD